MGKSKLAVIAISVLLLVSCSSGVIDHSKTPMKDDSSTVEIPQPVIPIDDATDIQSDFSEKEVIFDDDIEKMSLVLNHLDTASVAKSEKTVEIASDGLQTMKVHCTWDSPACNIYIGFLDPSNESSYVFGAYGGTLEGILTLSSVPDGNYHVIMYSDDNEDVLATVLYQFH